MGRSELRKGDGDVMRDSGYLTVKEAYSIVSDIYNVYLEGAYAPQRDTEISLEDTILRCQRTVLGFINLCEEPED